MSRPDITSSDFAALEHTADQREAMQAWRDEREREQEAVDWRKIKYDAPPPFSWGDAGLAILIVTVVVALFASLVP